VQFQCKNETLKMFLLALNNAIDTVESDEMEDEKLYLKLESYFIDKFFDKEPKTPRYVCFCVWFLVCFSAHQNRNALCYF